MDGGGGSGGLGRKGSDGLDFGSGGLGFGSGHLETGSRGEVELVVGAFGRSVDLEHSNECVREDRECDGNGLRFGACVGLVVG